MKQVRICAVCGKPYRRGRMYKIQLERKIQVAAGIFVDTPPSIELICPKCNREAGYKSRKKDFE